MTGGVAQLQDLLAAGFWSQKERGASLKVLEIKAVQYALSAFLSILGESVVLTSDNATVVTYLKKQGSTVSMVMCSLFWPGQNCIW